jgi:hypothetical protein
MNEKKGVLKEKSSLHRRQTRHTTKPLLSLRLEQNLNPKLLTILIEPSPVPIIPSINLLRLQLKPTSLIRLRRNNEILILIIRILNLLLISRHKPHARQHPRRNLLELQLEQQSLLMRQRVADLGNFVSRPPDLDQLLLDLHAGEPGHRGLVLVFAFAGVARGAAGEVRLVLAALRVGEVGAIVLVDCQAETAFEAAEVVFEDVGVFFDVDCFQRELAQSLASVGVGGGFGGDAAAAEFGACAVLGVVLAWFGYLGGGCSFALGRGMRTW